LQKIGPPYTIFEEHLQMRGLPGTSENRVDNMIKKMKQELPGPPDHPLATLMCSVRYCVEYLYSPVMMGLELYLAV
jgi:hypothetical protein